MHNTDIQGKWWHQTGNFTLQPKTIYLRSVGSLEKFHLTLYLLVYQVLKHIHMIECSWHVFSFDCVA